MLTPQGHKVLEDVKLYSLCDQYSGITCWECTHWQCYWGNKSAHGHANSPDGEVISPM